MLGGTLLLPGEQILVETPLIKVRADPSEATYAELQKQSDAFSLWAMLRTLTPDEIMGARGTWPTISKETQALALEFYTPEDVEVSHDVTVVSAKFWRKASGPSHDRLEKLKSIWQFNSYELPEEDGMELMALFTISSFFNHSCEPNAFGRPEANRLSIRAFRPIKAGEEITISYLDPNVLHQSTNHRRDFLQKSKGFHCGCQRCTGVLDDTRVFHCPRCAGMALAVSDGLAVSDLLGAISAGKVVCTVCGSLTLLEGKVLLEAEARVRSWMPIRWGKQVACSWFSTSADALQVLHRAESEGLASAHWAARWLRDAALTKDDLSAANRCELCQERVRVQAAVAACEPHALHHFLLDALARLAWADELQKSDELERLAEAVEQYHVAVKNLEWLLGKDHAKLKGVISLLSAAECKLSRLEQARECSP
eukprot:gnl/TRDRNA2_/TRDRNA2_173390_c0_seq6.p1 gnl/TRDRNA2_/TRDRNA2_173390_c0~~gnl/TRDRNA2_/TRDRNA2_173390_c0_seq6.p1  ORF type:complete len:426 (+),score=51.31 gnl/TRDRNA2_/TRDRNA2_173390_c0_seq6:117-1394(+)